MNLLAKGPIGEATPPDYAAMDYSAWLTHFDARAERYQSERLAYDERPLSAFEAMILRKSIAQFQLGEVSDGAYLIKAITDYAMGSEQDDLMPLAHKLVREARHHAFLLAQFMDHHSLPKARRHLLNTGFRIVRRLGRAETMLSTLLVAELVATHYYQCLGHSTRSVMLKRITAELLEDEQIHIHLYRKILTELRAGRPHWLNILTSLIERFVLASALLAVWPFHHKVYRSAGTNFAAYWQIYWRRYNEAIKGGGPSGA